MAEEEVARRSHASACAQAVQPKVQEAAASAARARHRTISRRHVSAFALFCCQRRLLLFHPRTSTICSKTAHAHLSSCSQCSKR